MTVRMKWLLSVCLVCGIGIGFAPAVHADFGPKPQITIRVVNPPDEAYCLDLLTYRDSVPDSAEWDMYGEEWDLQDPKIALLSEYGEAGWYPALVRADMDSPPLWGELTGTPDGDDLIHTFRYFGVPDRFKIITVTAGLEVAVTKEIERSVFDFHVTYDMETGELSSSSVPASYVSQFAVTLLSTLLIEGLVLLLFRFRLKENWKVFLAVNVGTQLLLTAVLGTALMRHGYFTAIFLYVPMEGLILAIEITAFMFLLRPRNKPKSVGYAVAANLASFLAGVFWYLVVQI